MIVLDAYEYDTPPWLEGLIRIYTPCQVWWYNLRKLISEQFPRGPIQLGIPCNGRFSLGECHCYTLCIYIYIYIFVHMYIYIYYNTIYQTKVWGVELHMCKASCLINKTTKHEDFAPLSLGKHRRCTTLPSKHPKCNGHSRQPRWLVLQISTSQEHSVLPRSFFK